MRFSVARKLGLGFAAVILLMVICSGIAYQRLQRLDQAVHVALDQSFPSALACRALIGKLHRSISLLRGIRIRAEGGETELVAPLQSEHQAVWRTIDQDVRQLLALSQGWGDSSSREEASGLAPRFEALQRLQQDAERLVVSPENNRAVHLLDAEATPLLDRMRAGLAGLHKVSAEARAADPLQVLPTEMVALEAAALATIEGLRSFCIGANDASKQRAEAEWRQFQNAFVRVEKSAAALADALRPAWEQFRAAYHAFEPIPKRVIAARESPDWNQAGHLTRTQIAPMEAGLVDTLQQLETYLVSQAGRQGLAVMDHQQGVVSALLIGTLLAITLASGIAFGLSRKLVSSIRAVSDNARRMAGGDLTGSELPVETRDELGELTASFNVMRAGLRDVAGQVRDATENVNSTAAEILASTQQQAAATREQAASIQEITSTIEEINQSGKQIGDRAAQVSALIETAASATQRGMSATQDTCLTMESIRNQVEEVAENVVGLSERTQSIGEIIATVSEIAEQSNLLALNASIEAVSAGEQGNRFSVVAHEMKSLADRAKECTVQVRTLLGEIQKGINSSVMLTEEAVKRAEGGKQQSHATESTIRQVAESNDENVQAFQQIVASANQQRIGVGQVTQGMQDIRQAVQQTSAGTIQLEKAAANMNALSQQLRRLVEHYQVG